MRHGDFRRDSWSGGCGTRAGRGRVRVLVAAATVALVVGLLGTLSASASTPHSDGGGVNSQSTGHEVHHGGYGETDVNACSTAVAPGVAHCDARVRTDPAATGRSSSANAGVSAASVPAGFGPADLQAAYHAPPGGAGQTVAIVDANDDPNAESDLAMYRSTFGLPPCTTANGCFRKVGQTGGTSYPTADHGWAEEISLDLDMVSALCSQCHILLVEANSANVSDLGASVNEAVALGANAVSNSYGMNETGLETFFDSYYDHPGVAITASSGDSGYGVEYPAASPSVVAVGGTTLTRNSSGFTETAWSRSGSGCSQYESKPSWQTDPGCANRTVADVSAVADPATGVAVNDTYGDPGFEVFGGTSVSSPIIASFYALANNSPSSGELGSYPYLHPGSLNDVEGGSNGTCSPAYLCTAGPGYDGPTGLGTPNTAAAFSPSTPPANDFSISASPTVASVVQGSSTSSTINTAITVGASQTVTLTTTGAPAGVSASLSPASITSGSSSTLTLAVAATTTPGTYPITITGTGATTHSTTFTLTVTGAPGSGGITNGGFESGNLSSWAKNGTASVGGSAHTGNYAAVVGSTASTNGDSSIAQTFTVPTGSTQLTFWYSVHCQDTVRYDWATVKVHDNTANTTSTLLGKTCTNTGAWRSGGGTLVAGHRYTLTLTNHDDNNHFDPTYTRYDDVTLGTAPPPPPPPPPGSGITNGGFETGNLTGWTPSGTTSVSTLSHTGNYAAQLGSSSPTTDSSLTQTVTTPGSATTISLTYLNFCPDTVTYDWATITLRDNTAGTTVTLLPHTCAPLPFWTNLSAPIVGGHNYTLTLASHDDNYPGDPTYTLYDDIALG
jgi:hypothetical protein